MIEITYDIKKVLLQDNKYYESYGWLIIDIGTEFNCWPIISGKYGRGSLPIGIYKVNRPIKLANQPENNPYKKEGFPWVSELKPLGKCVDDQGERTGLYMHPDGNLLGTLGCTGVIERDISLYDMLIYIFDVRKEREVRLNVL